MQDSSGHQQGEYKDGCLSCQTPTSTVRQHVEGCRVKNGGCRIDRLKTEQIMGIRKYDIQT